MSAATRQQQSLAQLGILVLEYVGREATEEIVDELLRKLADARADRELGGG